MMLSTLLKTLLLPPALPLLMIIFGLLLIGGRSLRTRVMARLWIGLGVISLWVLAMPVTSAWLHKPLESGFAAHSPLLTPTGVEAIVVLGAGRHYGAPEYQDITYGKVEGAAAADAMSTALQSHTLSHSALWRLRYGAYLSKRWSLPVIVSGGSVRPFDHITEAEMGVRFLQEEMAVAVAWPENRSRNTWENAQLTSQLLQGKGIGRVALVTHAYHMPRSVYAFQQAGIEVVAMPTGQQSHIVSAYWLHWLPSAKGLQQSYLALHEYLGLLFYRLK